jgi:diguanylate cyclase (GGDEF)-like protein
MNEFKYGYPTLVLLISATCGALWVVLLGAVSAAGVSELIYAFTTAGVTSCSGSVVALYLMRPNRLDSKERERQAHAASHDALTGLINRPEMFRQLGDAIEDAEANEMVLGVLFLDLDRFKVVNDSMGHEVGDEVLRVVARRLQGCVRSTDVVARLGGDEFVVICRDLLSADSVVGTAAQILATFDNPVVIGGQDHRIGTSIGISLLQPGERREPDELISNADAAMYRAKETRSGYAVFDEAHRSQLADRLAIERDLQVALDQGQLEVHYQPILDLASRSLYAFEALVRWNHPDRGPVDVDAFLSVAAESGLMGQLGDFVMREACAQMSLWRHRWPGAAEVKISVNLAEQQLVNPALPVKVSETLAWAGLGPQSLILEITEDVIVEHLEGLTTLRELRDMGVSLSIDDFGTGQSSLSYIKQFDMVSSLKIDKTFVRDMQAGRADRAIINAVVAISTDLGLRVVAEGVEFEEQLRELRDMGIDLQQGYLLSKPLPASRIDPSLWFPAAASAPPPRRQPEPAQAPREAADEPGDVSRSAEAGESAPRRGMAGLAAAQSAGGGATKSMSSSTAPTSDGSRSR